MSHTTETGSVAGFPAELFRLDGDPPAIRGSAAGWTAFGAEATDASIQIQSLDSSLFSGPEGDQYRDGLSHDLVPNLHRTGQAYTQVGQALATFADRLSVLQDQMRPLTVRASNLWDELQAARANLGYAQAADEAQAQARLDAQLTATPFAPDHPEPPDTYQSYADSTSAAVSAAQQAWDSCVAEATQLKSTHTSLIDDCCHTIEAAKGLAFAKNPHGLGALTAGFKTFVKDHAGGLAQISNALKLASGIASALAFIPVLDIVAAPVAIATGAAALAIDGSLKYATGQGSWTSVAIDAALMALPGAGKLARAATGSSVRLATGLNKATQDARAATGAEHQARTVVDDVKAGARHAGRAPAERANPEFFGGRETYTRREYDPDQAGGEVQHLDASLATIHHAGVDAVANHLNRFVIDAQLGPRERSMLDRLRAVASGEIRPTTWDLNFYTHELRESERYAALGHTTGYLGSDDLYEVWNDVHTATLRDYGVRPDDLYHPEVRK